MVQKYPYHNEEGNRYDVWYGRVRYGTVFHNEEGNRYMMCGTVRCCIGRYSTTKSVHGMRYGMVRYGMGRCSTTKRVTGMIMYQPTSNDVCLRCASSTRCTSTLWLIDVDTEEVGYWLWLPPGCRVPSNQTNT